MKKNFKKEKKTFNPGPSRSHSALQASYLFIVASDRLSPGGSSWRSVLVFCIRSWSLCACTELLCSSSALPLVVPRSRFCLGGQGPTPPSRLSSAPPPGSAPPLSDLLLRLLVAFRSFQSGLFEFFIVLGPVHVFCSARYAVCHPVLVTGNYHHHRGNK